MASTGRRLGIAEGSPAYTVPARPGHDPERILIDGSFILGGLHAPVLYNVLLAEERQAGTADDPWGFANSLEWATSCPPAAAQFTSIPRIRCRGRGPSSTALRQHPVRQARAPSQR